MVTIHILLAVAALVLTILAFATNKVPLWAPVLLISILLCLEVIPLR